ncbi:Uncharacterised protein [Mycobacteroides abscessus subsp. abscessus]|nr:Uncharacterised protein [Mycobacteroides abscessus subsp. abscessus]SLI44020.1 Uncharacterised protein [Mycobacteroides abscessus subsp. abscessus]
MSSSLAEMLSSTPATGDGISVSTLSVETSTSGSSTPTSSPTFLSQRVTVPSVTDSPSSGILTEVPEPAGAAAAGGSAAGSGAAAAVASGAGAGVGSGAGAAAGAGAGGAASPASLITPSSPPISTVSSSRATILVNTPEVGAGISVSTLSVDTSSNGSSTSTVSPSCLSHRVTVPSVTLSPRAGIWTEKAMVSTPENGSDSGTNKDDSSWLTTAACQPGQSCH